MEYEVRYSRRRTLALEIQRDGTVLVRAPLGLDPGQAEQFVSDHVVWIAEKRQVMLDRQARHPEPTPLEAKELRYRAWEILPGRVAYWARRMGVAPTGLHITSARTRFGSCSGKNALSFSWRLMLYPPEAIDYVVVHELCHIRHHDHSPRFWAEVAKYLPDYPARQALLKE